MARLSLATTKATRAQHLRKLRIAVRKPKRIGGKPKLEPQRIHHEIEESLRILSHK